MKTLFKNIKELIQIRDPEIKKVDGLEMKELPSIKDAWLLIEDDKIVDFGSMESFPENNTAKIIDASGKLILPAWCDSHTHIVYAGNRELEFADRINGLSYEEIANRGGGILNSAKTLQETPEDEVYLQSAARLEEVMKLGTGAVEIKSGYGLTEEGELKMLRVIKKLQQHYDIPIKSTFLGAHAIPTEYQSDPEKYMDLVINEILPKVANQNLAEYIDIFCEKGYFSVEDTHKLLSAAKKYGMKPKIHVNQFHAIGGIKAGVEHKALSVDHLEVMTNEDIESLKNTETMPVALPSCSLFLSIPYTPARKILDAQLPIALATDFNPGSTPSGNMNLVLSLACIKMKMTPEEAINAATINGAYAMELSDVVGSITKGKKANLIMTKKIPSYTFLPYAFGSNNIDTVYINGKAID
ncbi:imidazolonepropionase [Zunongwangia profunda]|uniref:Imidazolonepropionase n=2 Tax=Zunongwangia profunda TaxID=398743 RepID=D5BLM3_ZUNPS|nr:imidazolonepropionase [Zunongwangia profunda]ADF51989.1 imidazolonepropionase [Zunongwangia profunda SM-A87]MAS70144.1 imidazolonepropionase [Zunongwangia sp.]HAJ83009.1 imidazolonepropionase [Zunongwangia profunda]HCV81540.1 imidazolonepropionase [Zunongwangia profunda]|tara:strand:- start:936 stop:2174 length:1239 start_codon:yes stop_codon:yes gene_type:complete